MTILAIRAKGNTVVPFCGGKLGRGARFGACGALGAGPAPASSLAGSASSTGSKGAASATCGAVSPASVSVGTAGTKGCTGSDSCAVALWLNTSDCVCAADASCCGGNSIVHERSVERDLRRAGIVAWRVDPPPQGPPRNMEAGAGDEAHAVPWEVRGATDPELCAPRCGSIRH